MKINKVSGKGKTKLWSQATCRTEESHTSRWRKNSSPCSIGMLPEGFRRGVTLNNPHIGEGKHPNKFGPHTSNPLKSIGIRKGSGSESRWGFPSFLGLTLNAGGKLYINALIASPRPGGARGAHRNLATCVRHESRNNWFGNTSPGQVPPPPPCGTSSFSTLYVYKPHLCGYRRDRDTCGKVTRHATNRKHLQIPAHVASRNKK